MLLKYTCKLYIMEIMSPPPQLIVLQIWYLWIKLYMTHSKQHTVFINIYIFKQQVYKNTYMNM